MKVTRSGSETSVWCGRWRAAGLSVGFVPTMGALHQGHVSLIRRAREECDRVVASIFVNPTQFGPNEDLASYPVTTDSDLEACRAAGTDLVFLGSPDDMYPPGSQTWVTVEHLSAPLCGKSRRGHFRGVATVVAKLLNIVAPHRAYFGLKDYQQCRVIERMVEDLHLDAEIRTCPTVRETDGLALSSRNVYLDADARRMAPGIFRALCAARDLVLAGESSVAAVRERMALELRAAPEIRVEYAEVLDADTLEEFEGGRILREPGGVLLAVAARVGRARLIDNVVVPPPGPAPDGAAGREKG